MQIDWRNLLKTLNVEWRDRGPNTSNGNVNICCPQCGNADSGFHLSISETKEAYYCYRRPNEHSGSNFRYLLIGLGMDRIAAVETLNAFMDMRGNRSQIEERVIDKTKLAKQWGFFEPADLSHDVRWYMQDRGIVGELDAANVVAEFGLRYSQHGQWSRRLLIPYRDPDGKLQSWSGRAIRVEMQPRYLTQTSDAGLIYVPTWDLYGKTDLIIVEGPIDALKIAIAARGTNVAAAALTGLAINHAKLLRLRRLCNEFDRVHLTLDGDADFMTNRRMQNELASALGARYPANLTLPGQYKDAGEMSIEEIKRWLGCRSILTRSRQ